MTADGAAADDQADAPVESPRDMAESAFTATLRALLHSVPGMLAVIFVDREGECIDYCATISPYDAKVIAAHMIIIVGEARERGLERGGEPWWIHVHGTERDLVVRRFGDDYALVVATRPSGISSMLSENIELAVRELRYESGIEPPIWEPTPDRVRVEVRLSTTGWAYAPKAYWHRGDRTMITDVLGRWVESEPGIRPSDPERQAICFMVRSSSGEELTLVHWVEEDVWERR